MKVLNKETIFLFEIAIFIREKEREKKRKNRRELEDTIKIHNEYINMIIRIY